MCIRDREPSSGLIDALADEIRRKAFIEILFVFKRIVLLSKWHRSAVKPAVHDFRDSRHRLAAVRTGEMDIVYIRTVKLDARIDVFLSFFHQFLAGTDAFQMAAFTSPHRNRRTPDVYKRQVHI